MIEGNELVDIRPTGKTVSSEKLIIRDTGLTTINKEINAKVDKVERHLAIKYILFYFILFKKYII